MKAFARGWGSDLGGKKTAGWLLPAPAKVDPQKPPGEITGKGAWGFIMKDCWLVPGKVRDWIPRGRGSPIPRPAQCFAP